MQIKALSPLMVLAANTLCVGGVCARSAPTSVAPTPPATAAAQAPAAAPSRTLGGFTVVLRVTDSGVRMDHGPAGEENPPWVEIPVRVVSALCAGGWGAGAHVELKLPPPPGGLTGLKRRIDLEIQRDDGDGLSTVVLSAPDVRFPWAGGEVHKGERWWQHFGAWKIEGDQVQVGWADFFP